MGKYKNLEARAEYQRLYNERRRREYQAKKSGLNTLEFLPGTERFPFYWEEVCRYPTPNSTDSTTASITAESESRAV